MLRGPLEEQRRSRRRGGGAWPPARHAGVEVAGASWSARPAGGTRTGCRAAPGRLPWPPGTASRPPLALAGARRGSGTGALGQAEPSLAGAAPEQRPRGSACGGGGGAAGAGGTGTRHGEWGEGARLGAAGPLAAPPFCAVSREPPSPRAAPASPRTDARLARSLARVLSPRRAGAQLSSPASRRGAGAAGGP